MRIKHGQTSQACDQGNYVQSSVPMTDSPELLATEKNQRMV